MNIKCDSRKVLKGDIFVALRGVRNDGHNYIEEAIKNGASKIVAEEGLYKIETIIVNDTRRYLINYLKENYCNLIKDLKIIGITGTNGKTTSSFLIYQALNKMGYKASYIGTIGFYMDGKVKNLNNTTPDLIDLYEMFIESKENGCKYVVMEVSSQALALKRVDGIIFDYAIFTNLTKDHLDYHLDMKSYALAKQELFRKLKDQGKAIINIDDDYNSFFKLKENNNITYGFNDSDYKIEEYETNIDGTKFIVNGKKYNTSLIGKHNVYNSVVTLIVLNEIENSIIENVFLELECPNGRMDKIKYGDNIIVIDYAHTPDAVKNIIGSFDNISHNNIITIVGCGGNRDKTKRSEMGVIATTLSDYVIFTSDNPRFENPKDILKDIVQNLDINNYEIIENRSEAIKKGIQMLSNNDILLVLGKGHENYQIIKDKKIDFDDKLEVLKNIRS